MFQKFIHIAKICIIFKILYTYLFKKYKGKWEIRTLLKNKRAQEFWRKVVNNASNGNYEEHLIRDNTRYAFYFEN